jgi:hypothetical protein
VSQDTQTFSQTPSPPTKSGYRLTQSGALIKVVICTLINGLTSAAARLYHPTHCTLQNRRRRYDTVRRLETFGSPGCSDIPSNMMPSRHNEVHFSRDAHVMIFRAHTALLSAFPLIDMIPTLSTVLQAPCWSSSFEKCSQAYDEYENDDPATAPHVTLSSMYLARAISS